MPLVWVMKTLKHSDQHIGLSILIIILLAGWGIHYVLCVQGIRGPGAGKGDFFVGVKGMVNKPGVYCFEQEPSLRELIRRAGGLQFGSSDDDYGLFSTFAQGTMVHVSTEYQHMKVSTEMLPAAYRITLLIPIAMNEASLQDLVAIPEIGPVLAGRIIDHRTRYGPFTAIDDLTAVPGIGKIRLSQIRPFVKI
jgi:competence protein ComEA